MTAGGGQAVTGPVPRATGLTRVWRQIRFNRDVREEAWQLLADGLEEEGTDLGEMLEAVARSFRLRGKSTVSDTLLELRAGIGQADLAERLRPYTGSAERILFTGIGHQNAGQLLSGAARILRMELALRKALVNAIAMPVLLVAALFGLVLFFGLELLPALAEVVDFTALSGLQKTVVDVTLALSANPWVPGVGIVGFCGMISFAMHFWTGPGRTQADALPPFSLARVQAGAGFLFAVIEYGRTGEPVHTDLLDRMAAASPPYARSRIRAISRAYVDAGNNLGAASIQAGQGFPAVQMTTTLEVLWNRPGGIVRAGKRLERWMGRVEDRVKAAMAVLNAVLLTLVAAVLLALLSIMAPVFDQLNQATGI